MRIGLAVLAFLSVLIAAPVQAACKMQQLLQLPVTMVGPRPTVPVTINGVEARFLIDSGAFYSMVAPSALGRFGLRAEYVPRGQVDGVGGRVNVQSTVAEDMILGGFAFHHLPFLVVEGAGESGLLGQNVLGVADVEYDLANGVVRLIRPEGCGADRPAGWSGGSVQSLDLLPWTSALNRRTQAYGLLNGQRIRLTFDTGAERSILTLKAAARAGVTPQSPGVVFAGQGRGIGHDLIDAWIGPFDRFAIGGEEISHMRITFGGLEVDDTDMLLGADFFLSHRVYVSNSQHKLYFTLNAQAVRATPAEMDIPTDAAGFERRGAAFMSRRDLIHAIEDFTRAIALDPADPKPLYSRGMARWDSQQAVLAMSDFDHALTLKPADAPTLIARGSLYAQSGDRARAHADLQAAARIASDDPRIGLAVGEGYFRSGFYDDAIAQYDHWIAANPHGDVGAALERRCGSRVMTKMDLDQALADCSAALRLNPRATTALYMRGLLHLLRGDYDAAIVDLDADLRLQPNNAIALYARGLSKQKTGQTQASDADIQAATAIVPKIADLGKRLGVGP